ncbi:DUF308 domain-containing protein [Candidatus Saccharibacteria bacterium]|nr:DUF308 domain-containing protein [Candidatus Saccharibacteria bacterium]
MVNTVVKRGFSAYIILMKNKLVASLMMLVSGAMMTIGALNNRGNDTKTLPVLITAAGVFFSFWSFYRIGYIKANYDKIEDDTQKSLEKRVLVLQAIETIAYIIVAVAGIYLLLNESLMNLILNLVVGLFTTFNGVMGAISLVKRWHEKNYRWYIRLVLTIFELIAGPYFIATANSVDISGLLIMGILTAVAGLIEIISVSSKETLKNTVKDGKDVVLTLKNGKAN